MTLVIIIDIEREKKLTGHVNSNGNLIGFVPESVWDDLKSIDEWVKLKEFSPTTVVAAEPKVHEDVVSTSAWYCFKHTLNLVLQLPIQSPLLDCFSVQHRLRLLIPLSFLNDLNFSSNNPEQLICKRIKKNVNQHLI